MSWGFNLSLELFWREKRGDRYDCYCCFLVLGDAFIEIVLIFDARSSLSPAEPKFDMKDFFFYVCTAPSSPVV